MPIGSDHCVSGNCSFANENSDEGMSLIILSSSYP